MIFYRIYEIKNVSDKFKQALQQLNISYFKSSTNNIIKKTLTKFFIIYFLRFLIFYFSIFFKNLSIFLFF